MIKPKFLFLFIHKWTPPMIRGNNAAVPILALWPAEIPITMYDDNVKAIDPNRAISGLTLKQSNIM